MRRARWNSAAFTLPVRPQLRHTLSDTGQKRKHRQQISRKSSKRHPETTHSSNIAIETVSFYEYYPNSNSKKSR